MVVPSFPTPLEGQRLPGAFASRRIGWRPLEAPAMRITCPNCSATYEVPAAVLGATPRAVRCARCETEWTPAEYADMPAPSPESPTMRALTASAQSNTVPSGPAPSGPSSSGPGASEHATAPLTVPAPVLPIPGDAAPRIEGEVKYRSPRRGGFPVEVAAALALSLALLASGAAAALVWRDALMQAWPPSARVFAFLHGVI